MMMLSVLKIHPVRSRTWYNVSTKKLNRSAAESTTSGVSNGKPDSPSAGPIGESVRESVSAMVDDGW
jgi:hypothetical protein